MTEQDERRRLRAQARSRLVSRFLSPTEQETEENLKIPQRDAIALLEELRMLFFGSGRVDRSILTMRSLHGDEPGS